MAELVAGKIINDRFEVTEHIDTGGFASVWKGHDRQLDRIVAIKRLVSERINDPALREEAISEARKIAAISHPNIVSVFDVIDYEGEILIVMEYLSGGSLHDYLRNLSKVGKWVCPVMSFDLIRGILSGLNAAHTSDRGPIIHKDLKPLNILFDRRRQPKIADFGIASIGVVDAIETTYPGKWEHEGTLGYKSPEQLKGSRLDTRSDLFNVGLIAYLLFVQFHPFIDPRFLFDYREMVLDPYRPVQKYDSARLPSETNAFLDALLSVDPEKRYSTAAEALSEFDHIRGKYENNLLDLSLNKYDFLKGNRTEDVLMSALEIAKGIFQCSRNGFYAQGAFLYEKSGMDFSDLNSEEKANLENNYNICRRRAGQEVSTDVN